MEVVNGETIASFDKSAKEEVRASIDLIRGKPYINIRVFYSDAGEWKPGKQGIVISADRYRELAEMIVSIGEHLRADGTLP
jgi:hypothetical protein